MNRRTFVQSLAGAAAASAAASSAAAATTRPAQGIRLGFDTYSLRAFKWKDIQLIDYAASQKIDTLQISSLGDYSSLEPEHLKEVRAHAEGLGILIDTGIGCVCPISKSWHAPGLTPEQNVVKGLTVAKALGAHSMRCFMGSREDRRTGRPIEEYIEATVKVFKAVRSQAIDLGVKIAIENHAGDMQARETKMLIEEAGKDYVGSNLDAGNPVQCIEDPQVTLEILGPYVVTTHIRDTIIYEHPRGAAYHWVAMGDGVINWDRFFATYQQVCPKAAVQLEIITGRPPEVIPYLEEDFWKIFPKTPASEFARFVALAKSGHPFSGAMIMEDTPGKKPAEYTTALKEQQRVDLERSFEFVKKRLGGGLK
jgi:sugar phosphate isomerase/epimerase